MSTAPEVALSAGAQRLVETVRTLAGTGNVPRLNHWLVALAEKHGRMIEEFTGITANEFIADRRRALAAGDDGGALSYEKLLELVAEVPGAIDDGRVGERDLARALVTAAGLEAAALPATAVARPVGDATPALDRYGRDLTEEARKGRLPTLIGREEELALTIEVLCRETKRNPVLIGPAGVGKTAIVEGLAQAVVDGAVPDHLAGIRIVGLQPSNLVAGSGVVGELQKRMEAILREATGNRIVLFIDEVHSIVGAGGREGSGDLGALLKPALARGQIACIGATTDDEYRKFIEPDRALERRFNVVRVQEMSLDETRLVLASHRDRLAGSRHVTVTDDVVDWLLRFGRDFLRNRAFPDKAVDLLEQCVAHAVAEGTDAVSEDMAAAVARRMVGMPLEVEDRLGALREGTRGLIRSEATERLVARLGVTLRGLDARAQRPNAVVLLAGSMAVRAGVLASAIAGSVYGADDRVVRIDFGQYDTPEDLNSLLGPPPGYIGFGDRLPLHAVQQMPWSVLVCENVDRCHPSVLEVLEGALADGVVTERSGGRTHLSDCVVVLTASSAIGRRATIGFGTDDGPSPERAARETAAQLLGPGLMSQVDVLAAQAPAAGEGSPAAGLLDRLAVRYRAYGVDLEWTPEFLAWVEESMSTTAARELERLVETKVGGNVIPLLERADRPRRIRVEVDGGTPLPAPDDEEA